MPVNRPLGAGNDIEAFWINGGNREMNEPRDAGWPRLGRSAVCQDKDGGDCAVNCEGNASSHRVVGETDRSVLLVTRITFRATASAASVAIFGQRLGLFSNSSNIAVVLLVPQSSFFQIVFPSRPTRVALVLITPPDRKSTRLNSSH